MNSLGRFVSITVGGILALMVIGMVGTAIFGVKAQEVKALDLISSWFWYRFTFYALFMLSWVPICQIVTRPRQVTDEMTEEEIAKTESKRLHAHKYMKKQWWKIAALFVFFEVVIIQQFGL